MKKIKLFICIFKSIKIEVTVASVIQHYLLRKRMIPHINCTTRSHNHATQIKVKPSNILFLQLYHSSFAHTSPNCPRKLYMKYARVLGSVLVKGPVSIKAYFKGEIVRGFLLLPNPGMLCKSKIKIKIMIKTN